MTRSTHHPHYQIFLDRLKAQRKALGVTQVKLAAALGNRQVFISKMENGERRLDVIELLEYFDGQRGCCRLHRRPSENSQTTPANTRPKARNSGNS